MWGRCEGEAGWISLSLSLSLSLSPFKQISHLGDEGEEMKKAFCFLPSNGQLWSVWLVCVRLTLQKSDSVGAAASLVPKGEDENWSRSEELEGLSKRLDARGQFFSHLSLSDKKASKADVAQMMDSAQTMLSLSSTIFSPSESP